MTIKLIAMGFIFMCGFVWGVIFSSWTGLND